MFAPFRKFQRAIGLVVIVIFLLTIIGWTKQEREQLTFVEEAVIEITAPFQGIVSGIGGRIQAAYTFIAELQELSEENRELRDKLSEYERLEVEVEELRQENQRLRDMLGFEEREAYELKPAKVIGRSADNWNRTIVLNKGRQDGVELNMPVVTDNGLVGQIISVSRSSSKVLLLIDPDSAVSGLIQDTREMGIVEGKDEVSGDLQMINIPKDAELSDGDKIISSGLGPVFPKGLVIGEVVELKEEMSGFTNKAIIKPSVNFSRLEEVFLIQDGGKYIDEEDYQDLQELEESEDESLQQDDGYQDGEQEYNEEDGMEE
ncbi:rod shape-determining protein MreC [Natranaerobius thermophilus]|uniref:Cell shape-determining protein MreC n=1 Tax=Natranaerobius thermophilus (strain ATCC BAA-1301 / DSM 18059 / JW/NM-WN-LF) TaxID=457570 RepID=B2A6A1_NATTJ|nr:rod shape-determining protein MreC [Natranaerobius thermophilus]ACB84112.1 rod shape-determining protein MreC [Natranaerobius thermophilus JW/NM-WN-LF]